MLGLMDELHGEPCAPRCVQFALQLALGCGRSGLGGDQIASQAREVAGDLLELHAPFDRCDRSRVALGCPPRARLAVHALELAVMIIECTREMRSGAPRLTARDQTFVDDCDRSADLTQLVRHTEASHARADDHHIDAQLCLWQRAIAYESRVVGAGEVVVPERSCITVCLVRIVHALASLPVARPRAVYVPARRVL